MGLSKRIFRLVVGNFRCYNEDATKVADYEQIVMFTITVKKVVK